MSQGGFHTVQNGSGKLAELEGLRGIAAIMVLLHHFLLLIAPRLHGREFPDDPFALVRTPLFALVNGSAAVSIFFVLSGFVLTLRAMERRDWRQLVAGALKRWPRLVPLVVIVNLVSAGFFLLGLYRSEGWFNPGDFADATGLTRAVQVLGAALNEGTFRTFVSGKAGFNPALWTMHYELFGSFAAYATGMVLIFQKSFARAMATGVAAMLLTAVFTGEGGFYFAMLVAGVLIARVYLEREALRHVLAFLSPWRIPFVLGTAALTIVVFGYDGYSKPAGFYAFMEPYASRQAEPLIHGIAAIALVFLVLFCEPIRSRLASPAGRLLGWLSFPVYLVHLPILHGLVYPVFVALTAHVGDAVAAAIAFVLFVALTLIVAYPLARLDESWVRKLRDLHWLSAVSQPASGAG